MDSKPVQAAQDWAALLDQVMALRTEQTAAALELLDQALGEGEPPSTLGDQVIELAALYRIRAEILRDQTNYARARLDAERFSTLAQSSGDQLLTVRALFLRGTIEAEQGFFGTALEHFHAARELLDASGNISERARILNAIAMTHNFAGDHERARLYFERALADARQAEDVFQTATYLSNLAGLVSELEGPGPAISMQREVLQIGQDLGRREVIAQATVNLCNLLVQDQQWEEAEAICPRALENADALDNRRYQAGTRLVLGNLALGRERVDEAVSWYEQALELARDSVPVVHEELLQRLADLHTSRGEAERALVYHQELHRFRDQQREREREAVREELEVRYQLERTQNELDLLLLGKELQTTQIRMRNALLIAMMIGLVLMVLVTVGALRGNRIRAELQRSLAKRNEDMEAALRQIEALARTDPLTGLLNRRALSELAEPVLAQGRRESWPSTVLLCDIDHFKAVNDQHGHAIGDALLVGFAGRLREHFRESDLIARWGGEEFLCLLPRTGTQAAESSLQRLREDLRQRPIQTSVGMIGLTLTWGIAEVQADLDEAIRRADTALYAGKQSGRNRITVHVQPGDTAA